MKSKAFLAPLIAIMFVFSGFASAKLFSSEVTSEVGKSYSTQWFQFTVNSIDKVDSYAGHSPEKGHELYKVLITQRNITSDPIPMGTADWYMDDESFEEYLWPIDPLDDTMMPEEFELQPRESAQHVMIFEIPVGTPQLMLMYTEQDENEKEGKTFKLHVNK